MIRELESTVKGDSMPSLNLRLPPDLRLELKHAASREHRSLHAEILSRLETIETVAVPRAGAPAAQLVLCDDARHHRRGTFCKRCGNTP